MKTTIKMVLWLSMALTLVCATGFVIDAKACKDCPFPMKVGDGKWIMPNGMVRLEIQTYELPSHLTEVHVSLRDLRTDEIVATGISKQRKDRKTVNVQLTDMNGQPVQGFVRYMDDKKNKIQARFSCEQCTISDIIE